MNTYEDAMKKHVENTHELREPRADYIQGTEARTIEDSEEYTRQGEYTVDDFYALTKGKKAELIDGVIYDMASALPAHDTIVMELGWQIDSYIRGNDGKCTLYTTSLDVQLDAADDRNIFEPDLMVVCDRNKCNGPRIIGAPDFIVEVLSPGTRQKDKTVKLWKYQQSGVREYWIVDPKKLKVIVHTFDPEDGDTYVYTFHDMIPVGIYDGDLVIDFDKIYERVNGMYGIGATDAE